MNQKLIDRLYSQTAQICDDQGHSLGTGFFVNDEIMVTAAHCVCREKMGDNKIVHLYRNSRKFGQGFILEDKKGVAFVKIKYHGFSQEDWFPLGYCEELQYGDKINIYGYPKLHPEGYPLHRSISMNYSKYDIDSKPSICCLVKNTEGALNQYGGLSGSPVVAGEHIIGMVAKEDEGGVEANAIYILDFSLVRDIFKQKDIDLEEVYRPFEGKNQHKAGSIFLYKQVWWMTKEPMGDVGKIKISDRYSTILATLLLGMQGEANIILASPWECGIAKCLQVETSRYEKEYVGWSGRLWEEYSDRRLPDWGKIRENSGVVLSMRAEECSDVWISELLAGRRRSSKNLLVIWNIWSEQPEQAVFQSMRVADRFDIKEGKEVLSVFASWKEINQTPEGACHELLVSETAKDWVESQEWSYMDLDNFLLKLNTEETDILVWEIYQRYRDTEREEWNVIYKSLRNVCSESIKSFLSFYEKGDDLECLLEVEPSILKRWFARMKKEDCREILSYLRERNNQVPYWNAVISNPYCTGFFLQEWCKEEKHALLKLIFGQNSEIGNDILLYEEADTIRRQLKPT